MEDNLPYGQSHRVKYGAVRNINKMKRRKKNKQFKDKAADEEEVMKAVALHCLTR